MAVSAGFPVPVLPLAGAGAWGAVQELRARPELTLVDTPRHASVALVAGSIPPEHREALDRAHDQVPHPRAVVRWHRDALADGVRVGGVRVDGGVDEVVEAVCHAHGAVAAGTQESSPDRLPDEEPNEWRGVGPHGQGGEGMMGGTPYGRPMAMTGGDRDGLALDRLRLRLGPFLAPLPPGVVFDLTLQGEVIQELTVELATPSATPPPPFEALPDDAARTARLGLRWLSHLLHVHGLDALSVRAARCAEVLRGGSPVPEFRSLRRSIHRSGLLRSFRDVGTVEDLGTAQERVSARLDEIGAALGGASAASPDPTFAWSGLGELLAGCTLTDAVTTVLSLEDRLVLPDQMVRP